MSYGAVMVTEVAMREYMSTSDRITFPVYSPVGLFHPPPEFGLLASDDRPVHCNTVCMYMSTHIVILYSYPEMRTPL